MAGKAAKRLADLGGTAADYHFRRHWTALLLLCYSPGNLCLLSIPAAELARTLAKMLFEEFREVEDVLVSSQGGDLSDPPVAVAQKICRTVHPRPDKIVYRRSVEILPEQR